MIQKMRVQNFKCLRDVEIALEPLTVLIGPNDTGKTSLLQAIEWLGRTTTQPIGQRTGDQPSLVEGFDQIAWRRKRNLKIGWKLEGNSPAGSFDYYLEIGASGVVDENLSLDKERSFALPANGDVTYGKISLTPNKQQTLLYVFAQHDYQDNRSQGQLVQVRDAISSSQSYRLDPHLMRSAALPSKQPELTEKGDNLAAVVDSILAGPDRAVVNEFERQLHDAIPSLQGLSAPPADQPGKKCLEFTLAGSNKPLISIPADHISDGAILVTGFLALAYSNSPQILLIEEPENGLHPSLLKLVVDTLRNMTTGAVGNRPRQVIMTTHSPLMLNFVEPKEVRIFRRDIKEGTKVTSMSEVPKIDRLLKEFAPGELWYLFGEEDLVKGSPS